MFFATSVVRSSDDEFALGFRGGGGGGGGGGGVVFRVR